MIIFGKGTNISLDNVFYTESYQLIDDDDMIVDTYATPQEAFNDMILQYGKYHKINRFKMIGVDEYEFYIDDCKMTIKRG